MVKGIDVSHWRQTINWTEVAKSGVRFAFMKASGGLGFKDPCYDANISGAKSNGIIYGAYHYFYPCYDALRQAQHFCEVIQGEYQLPPVLDVERSYNQSWATVAKATMTALKEIERLSGTKPILYTNVWFGHYLGDAKDYDLWIAHYTSRPYPSLPKAWEEWKFWQYTDKGKVPGVPGTCDMNWWKGTLKELRDYCGLEHNEEKPYRAELFIPAGEKVIDITINMV